MRIVGFLLAGFLLSSCSLFEEKVEEPKSLSKLSYNIEIRERWQKTVGKGLGELYQVIKPAITETTVFANDVYGRVYAFDKQTGAKKWMVNLKFDLAAGVGLGEQLLLVGSLDGDVVALDQISGDEIWRTNIASEILAPPQTNGDVVVVQTNEGKLYGLNAGSGEFIWQYSVKLPLLTLRGTATPQLFGNNLITGFSNGKIAALSAKDGVLYWERRIASPRGSTEINRVVDVDGSPVISGNSIYSTSYNGAVTAIAPNGQVRWSEEVSSHQTPLVMNGRVFVSGANGTVYAFDQETGLPLWNNALLLYRKLSAPQSVSGFVVVSDYRGYIHVFDPELGVIISRARFDKDGIRSPMVSDGTFLYALGNDGELSSISIHLTNPNQKKNKPKKEEIPEDT